MPQAGLPLSAGPPAPAAALGRGGFLPPAPRPTSTLPSRVSGPCLTRQAFWKRLGLQRGELLLRRDPGRSFLPGGEVIGEMTLRR